MSLFYETCARLFLAEPFQLGSTIAKEDANHTDTQSEGWRCKTWQKAIDGSTSQSRTSRHLSSTKEPGLKKALKKPTDLVLAAGGDGTTAKVASRLVDSGIPLSVLPLGTANNLARALGFVASPEEIITRLEGGRKRAFDVGFATGPWGERYFFEAAGGGLLADYVRAAKKEEKKNKTIKKLSKEQEMARHSALLCRMLHDYPARKWKIELDGKDISGRYILWEAMNIHSVGPALYLAPRAGTRDGRFDFACARPADSALLAKHFEARVDGKKSNSPLPARKFRKLRVVWKGPALHLDDKLWPKKKQSGKSSNEIEITVKPSALIILQPAPAVKT